MMLAMQREQVDILHYYDMRMGNSCCGGLFNSETRKPNNTYWVFHMFNALYKLGGQVACESDDEDVYTAAATNGKRSTLVIANTKNEQVEIDLALCGVALSDVEVLRIDSIYRYTLTGERIKDGKIILPPYGCAQLRFWD